MDNRNEEELRASFLNQPLMPYIGAKLATISQGKASIEVDYRKNTTQYSRLLWPLKKWPELKSLVMTFYL